SIGIGHTIIVVAQPQVDQPLRIDLNGVKDINRTRFDVPLFILGAESQITATVIAIGIWIPERIGIRGRTTLPGQSVARVNILFAEFDPGEESVLKRAGIEPASQFGLVDQRLGLSPPSTID